MSGYPPGEHVAGMMYNDQFGQYDAPAVEPNRSGGFLKVFGGQKKTTRDGQPAKKRGPKPDSKPAMTRRQELNRQAQRTHRERKEQYIRTLEAELSRLRETYSVDINAANKQIQQQNEAMQQLKAENERLMGILKDCGIPVESQPESLKINTQSESYTAATSSIGSQSATYRSQPAFLTTPPTTFSSPQSAGSGEERMGSRGDPSMQFTGTAYHSGPDRSDLDFSSNTNNTKELTSMPGIFDDDPQLGIDLILQLEAPCRVHTEYLCREAHKDVERDAFFSGHALMASCPPPSHIENVPEGNQYPHQTYQLPLPNLEKLLNLSKQLITDGQVTPIMILQSLKNHAQYQSLTRDDVKTIIETLNTKVRCYGFGAVVEDFELRDCLQGILGAKLYHTRTPPSRVGDDALYR